MIAQNVTMNEFHASTTIHEDSLMIPKVMVELLNDCIFQPVSLFNHLSQISFLLAVKFVAGSFLDVARCEIPEATRQASTYHCLVSGQLAYLMFCRNNSSILILSILRVF